MKALHGILIGCLLTAIPLWCRAEIAVNSLITIKPGNPDAAADRLVVEAERLQGYFVTKSSNSVVLKIPSSGAGAMQKFIENTWLVYAQDYQAQDISGELIDARARLKAKEELLGEYQKVLDTAPVDKVVSVAAAVTKLVEEIELLRGRIRLLEHTLQYATITVSFTFDRDRDDRRDTTSPFAWLNSLGLQQMLGDFAR